MSHNAEYAPWWSLSNTPVSCLMAVVVWSRGRVVGRSESQVAPDQRVSNGTADPPHQPAHIDSSETSE